LGVVHQPLIEKMNAISLFFLILWGIFFGFPQSLQSSGFKYFKNYSPLDYDNQAQNWVVLQDKRGIIYMANQGGLMEFDGVSWRIIHVPNRVVRSMAIDDTTPHGTIYIGGINEIGFAAPDIMNKLQYISLLDRLPQNTTNFADVFASHCIEKKIYFQTAKFLFRWDPYTGQMKTFEIEAERKSTFTCGGKLYINQTNTGLATIERDSFKPLPGIREFPSRICMICPYDTGRILIGTASDGLFLYDGVSTVPFPTEADELIKENELFSGIRLSSVPGQFALASSRGGLFIIDSRGKLKYTFNKTSGLPDDAISDIFEDTGGNLWLSLEKGLAKIEYASPFYIHDDRDGLSGLGLAVVKHDGVLFTGTTNGLFYLTSTGKFRIVPGLTQKCWWLLSTGDSLLAALSDGTYRVEVQTNGLSVRARKVMDYFTYVLYRSKQNPNRIWAGTLRELISLYRVNETAPWNLENITATIGQQIKSIVEDEKGNLWLGTRSSGVFKVDFTTGNTSPKITHFTQSHGLPSGKDKGVNVSTAAGHVLFLTGKGLARFDEKENRFSPDKTLGYILSLSPGNILPISLTVPVFRLIEDKYRNIWFHSASRNYQAILKPDGTYDIIPRPFHRIPRAQVNCIYYDAGEDSAWFASIDGLIRYDPGTKKNSPTDFNALIRKVELINGKIPVFNGYREDNHLDRIHREFAYKDSNIRFEFASPFFEDEKRTRYTYRLDGYDDDWAPFSTETQKDYTNLGPGTYKFRVQAQNVYGDLSREGIYRFKVLPPWYKTWWAFLGYAIFAFYLVFLLIKWRSGKLEREKRILERIVKERTREIEARNIEINEKNLQLESQTTQLKEQSEKLQEMDRIKSRFFANISHEFRTPLTLIMGPLEQKIAACRDDDIEEKRKLTLMLRNAQRLLRLINQLLELSKLDSGKMKLQAAKTDIIPFLKGIIDSFRLLAQQNELDLEFQAEAENRAEAEKFTLYLDPRKMEDIMANLLVNAIKFTPAGGKITVTLQISLPTATVNVDENLFPAGFFEISVSDTGPGIPADQLLYIFDRFYQAETAYEIQQKGTGIGLALAKELVELHHGTIEAQSREGEGSTVIIRLPLGSSHLAPDEIVEFPDAPTQTPTPSHDITFNEITAGETGTEKEKGEKTAPWALVNLEAVIGKDDTDIILVVEDSADMRDYIRGALEPGYTVVDARDGREGMQKAREIIPDLIISDIMMPEVDGYELCRVLKSDVNTSHIPIILLTAKAAEENIIQGLETGADDYITKPFNTNILIARIKNLIDIRSQLQKNINREMTQQPVKTSVSTIDREFLHDLHEAIRKNLADEEFNVEQLCKKLYMGRTTLYRKVLALTGETPTDFIRSCRLKQGAELLKQKNSTVLEVAFAVGFSNSSYFAKCFREKFHQLPSEYQAAGK
jgi:signal transduction histidine kinase/DNA-binding response OmpR family regulator